MRYWSSHGGPGHPVASVSCVYMVCLAKWLVYELPVVVVSDVIARLLLPSQTQCGHWSVSVCDQLEHVLSSLRKTILYHKYLLSRARHSVDTQSHLP